MRFYPVSVGDPSGILRDLSQEKVVFHGINKSGSLAMFKVLKGAYQHAGRGEQIFGYYNKPPKGEASPKYIIRHQPPGHALFVGHYLYKALDAPGVAPVYVTQVRHPLQRAVSVWKWLQKNVVKAGGAPEDHPSLLDWARHQRSHSQVVQLGRAYGPGASKLPREAREEYLEKAKQAIDSDLAFVGLADRFEESIFVLAHMLGLPAVPLWQRDKRNPDRPPVASLSEEETAVIREAFALDFQLYDYARERFEARLAALRFNKMFDKYQRLCAGQYIEALP